MFSYFFRVRLGIELHSPFTHHVTRCRVLNFTLIRKKKEKKERKERKERERKTCLLVLADLQKWALSSDLDLKS